MVDGTDQLDVATMWDAGAIVCAGQINARSPSCEQAPLIIATVSASACTGMLPKPK